MNLTSDRGLVLRRTAEIFGHEIDGITAIEQMGGYAFEGDGGVMFFVCTAPGEYRVTMGFDEDVRGAPAIAAMNSTYAWMFNNTDTDRIVGYIDPDDAAHMAIVPLVYGAAIVDEDNVAIGEITRARWTEAVSNG